MGPELPRVVAGTQAQRHKAVGAIDDGELCVARKAVRLRGAHVVELRPANRDAAPAKSCSQSSCGGPGPLVPQEMRALVEKSYRMAFGGLKMAFLLQNITS